MVASVGRIDEDGRPEDAAQISNLPYRRFPTCSATARWPATVLIRPRADRGLRRLAICDTADWQSALHGRLEWIISRITAPKTKRFSETVERRYLPCDTTLLSVTPLY